MSTWSNPFEQSEFMLEAIKEVRSEKQASEYEFLDKIEKIHSAPNKKGNSGLANAYAELAIYKENGEIKIDHGLIEELDKRLAEDHEVKERQRFKGIVADSQKRPGKNKNSLLENQVDGHKRITDKIEDFYDATGNTEQLEQLYRQKGLKLGKATDGGPQKSNNTISVKPINQQQGGGKMSTKIEEIAEPIEETLSSVESRADHDEAVVDLREYTEQNIRWADFRALAEEYESLTEDLVNTITYSEDRLDSFEGFMNSYFDDVDEALEDFRDYVDFMNNEARDAAARISAANDRLGREDGSGIKDILEKYKE